MCIKQNTQRSAYIYFLNTECENLAALFTIILLIQLKLDIADLSPGFE